MSDEPVGSRLADLLRTLKPKDRQPVSAAVLNNWIFQAESKLDVDDRQVFLLKGGTLLQHRLTSTARATKDVDGLVRADLDASSWLRPA